MAEIAPSVPPVSAAPPALEALSITKRYGAILACDQVDFAVDRGEIHGVLGQNGAGKTTLMNVLLGLVRPDHGSVSMDGKPVSIRDPIEAAACGIAMVHQHFSLIESLSVWENVTLGERGKVDERTVSRRVARAAGRYGLDVDPHARVGDLTTGQRQRVEIVKCLLKDPQVLIFDEPTSVLTVQESFELFRTLRQVVLDEHRAVVLISHKLDEILYATDRVTIMRDGAVVARSPTADATAEILAQEMVGHRVTLRRASAAVGHLALADDDAPADDRGDDATGNADSSGDAGSLALAQPFGARRRSQPWVLDVADAVVVGADGRRHLDGLSLQVAPGEIVGLAGVDGNGQHSLCSLLAGLRPLAAGSVRVDGFEVACGRPGCTRDAGVGVITDDRHVSGCVLDMSVMENLLLSSIDGVTKKGFVDRRRMRQIAAGLVEEFAIKVPSLDAPMRSLSGGNQQKLVLARELASDPKVLVAAQPTHGLDVGAIDYMNGRLRAAARGGVGVLLISTELEEILDLSDRVVVIHRGRIMGEMARADTDLARIGLLMGGTAA